MWLLLVGFVGLVVLALLGGLCFGVPVFWWLNTRRGSGLRDAVRGV